MWIGFMAVGLAAGTVVFIWAVRARQFANQERARYLALQSGIPRDDDREKVGAVVAECATTNSKEAAIVAAKTAATAPPRAEGPGSEVN
jgi:nitrogen fixation-related uncharacterized protein